MSKSFENSKTKQACREKLVDLTKEHIPNVKTFVTLPSRLALCVKTFKSTFRKINVIGIERDPEIFEEICNQNIYCVNADIRHWIHSQIVPASHTDVIFMDYYSHFHQGIIDDIKSLLNNCNIIHSGKKTLLGLTLSKGMRVGKDDTLDYIKEYVWDEEVENNLETVARAIKNIINCNERRPNEVSCVYKKEYRTGQQMYFFVFLVTY